MSSNFNAIQLPQRPETPNIRALSQRARERFVPGNGVTSLFLAKTCVSGSEEVFKNGTLLDWGGATPAYTVQGATVTLTVAANGTDVFVIYYWYRA